MPALKSLSAIITSLFAPNSAQEAVNVVYNAWDYAERDRNPVLVLMDGCLGNIMEEVELPPMKELSDVIRVLLLLLSFGPYLHRKSFSSPSLSVCMCPLF